MHWLQLFWIFPVIMIFVVLFMIVFACVIIPIITFIIAEISFFVEANIYRLKHGGKNPPWSRGINKIW